MDIKSIVANLSFEGWISIATGFFIAFLTSLISLLLESKETVSKKARRLHGFSTLLMAFLMVVSLSGTLISNQMRHSIIGMWEVAGYHNADGIDETIEQLRVNNRYSGNHLYFFRENGTYVSAETYYLDNPPKSDDELVGNIPSSSLGTWKQTDDTYYELMVIIYGPKSLGTGWELLEDGSGYDYRKPIIEETEGIIGQGSYPIQFVNGELRCSGPDVDASNENTDYVYYRKIAYQ